MSACSSSLRKWYGTFMMLYDAFYGFIMEILAAATYILELLLRVWQTWIILNLLWGSVLMYFIIALDSVGLLVLFVIICNCLWPVDWICIVKVYQRWMKSWLELKYLSTTLASLVLRVNWMGFALREWLHWFQCKSWIQANGSVVPTVFNRSQNGIWKDLR